MISFKVVLNLRWTEAMLGKPPEEYADWFLGDSKAHKVPLHFPPICLARHCRNHLCSVANFN